MPGNFRREDLRIARTQRALMSAMPKLLRLRNFTQITINDICEEAQISRTTFYLHFSDKYDLLKFWLMSIRPEVISKYSAYEDVEKSINELVVNNAKIIRHLIEGATDETTNLLSDYLFSLLDEDTGERNDGQKSPKQIVYSTFCSGGIMNYLLWQVKNQFPIELKTMNTFLFDILMGLLNWNASH